MKKVNIIYDDMYSDTDVIAVPDEIYDRIELLAQNFDSWLFYESPKDDPEYWVIKNGKEICNLETTGFVKWLNCYYCNRENAYVVEQHIPCRSELKRVEF